MTLIKRALACVVAVLALTLPAAVGVVGTVVVAGPALADHDTNYTCYDIDAYRGSSTEWLDSGVGWTTEYYDHYYECTDGHWYWPEYRYSWSQGHWEYVT